MSIAALAARPAAVLRPLQGAAAAFGRLGARAQQAEALYLQARTLHTLGRTAERDAAAAAALACDAVGAH